MSAKTIRLGLVLLLLAICGGPAQGGESWPGVDETVVEKHATAAGRPPARPFFDPGEGDLLRFLFLVAGAAGGFVMGYAYRELFPPKAETTRSLDVSRG